MRLLSLTETHHVRAVVEIDPAASETPRDALALVPEPDGFRAGPFGVSVQPDGRTVHLSITFSRDADTSNGR